MRGERGEERERERERENEKHLTHPAWHASPRDQARPHCRP